MDFYTHFSENNDVTTFHVFALFGYDMAAGRGAFADAFGPMRNVTETFLKQQLPLYYQAQLEEEQERAGDLQDAVSQLKDEISDHEEEIAQLRQEIEKKRDRLAEKSAQLSSASTSREEAAKALEQLNSLLNQVINQ